MAQPWNSQYGVQDHRGNHRSDDHGRPDRHDRRDHREIRHWRPGDRLPAAYHARRHVIVKPVAYHLHRPPRGHQWVRVGADAMLVAVGTGVVIEVVHSLFH
jgi:Ni/Co efflux regulator RcnB